MTTLRIFSAILLGLTAISAQALTCEEQALEDIAYVQANYPEFQEVICSNSREGRFQMNVVHTCQGSATIRAFVSIFDTAGPEPGACTAEIRSSNTSLCPSITRSPIIYESNKDFGQAKRDITRLCRTLIR